MVPLGKGLKSDQLGLINRRVFCCLNSTPWFRFNGLQSQHRPSRFGVRDLLPGPYASGMTHSSLQGCTCGGSWKQIPCSGLAARRHFFANEFAPTNRLDHAAGAVPPAFSLGVRPSVTYRTDDSAPARDGARSFAGRQIA